MRELTRLAAVVALALALAAGPAVVVAQDTTPPVVTTSEGTTTIATDDTVTTVEAPDAETIVVPYGNWIDALLENALAIVGAVVLAIFAWLGRFLPKKVTDILSMIQAEQLLVRAAEYGINATRGAVRGRELSVDVGNEAIARAVQYAIDNGPRWLIEWMGGATAIRDKIIARIPLDETVEMPR